MPLPPFPGRRKSGNIGCRVFHRRSPFRKCAKKAQITIPPKSAAHCQYAGPGQDLHRFAPEGPNWLQIPGVLRKTVYRLVAMVFQKPIFTRDIPEKSLTGPPQKKATSVLPTPSSHTPPTCQSMPTDRKLGRETLLSKTVPELFQQRGPQMNIGFSGYFLNYPVVECILQNIDRRTWSPCPDDMTGHLP